MNLWQNRKDLNDETFVIVFKILSDIFVNAQHITIIGLVWKTKYLIARWTGSGGPSWITPIPVSCVPQRVNVHIEHSEYRETLAFLRYLTKKSHICMHFEFLNIQYATFCCAFEIYPGKSVESTFVWQMNHWCLLANVRLFSFFYLGLLTYIKQSISSNLVW